MCANALCVCVCACVFVLLPPAVYRWSTGEWGGCDTTCENGNRHRAVFCYNLLSGQRVVAGCDIATRPADKQPCFGGIEGCRFTRNASCPACQCTAQECGIYQRAPRIDW